MRAPGARRHSRGADALTHALDAVLLAMPPSRALRLHTLDRLGSLGMKAHALGLAVVMLGCSRADSTAPSSPPTQPSAPSPQTTAAPAQPDVATLARVFTAWIALHKAAPQKVGEGPPDCESSGPTAGVCRSEVEIGEAGENLACSVLYFKSAPIAARFSAHFDGALSCPALRGATVTNWGERAGMFGASGEHCEFNEGPLRGLAAIIENNRDRSGHVNAGLHVFSPQYLKRDVGFAAAVKTDDSRAR